MHRVADMAEFEIQNRDQVTVVMVKLPGVRDAGSRPSIRESGMAVEPAQAEGHEGVRLDLLGMVAAGEVIWLSRRAAVIPPV